MSCVLVIASLGFFCQPGPPVDSYCAIAAPVFLSHADTRGTKVQVNRENSKWKNVCKNAGGT